MSKITLVQKGIFPITKDQYGNPIGELLDTGLQVPGTVQGEGKWLGTPCLFIRTSACNLRCIFIGPDGKGSPCDTPFSSHHPEKNRLEVDEVLAIIGQNIGNMEHVVVSGGEPLMQAESLGELLIGLTNIGLKTTVETNATIYDEVVADHTSLVSMSPKLNNSTPYEANTVGTGIKYNEKWAEKHERLRRNIPVIQQYIDRARHNGHQFQLKFVVTKPEDIEEIESDFLAHLERFKSSDVYLMPEGVTSEDLATKTSWIIEHCVRKNYNFTPRLHVTLFGTKRGV